MQSLPWGIQRRLLGSRDRILRILAVGLLLFRLHWELRQAAVVAGAREHITAVQIIQAAHHVGLGLRRSEDVNSSKEAAADRFPVGVQGALIHSLGRNHATLHDARRHSGPTANRTGTESGGVIHGVHGVVGVAVGLTESDVVSAIHRIHADVRIISGLAITHLADEVGAVIHDVHRAGFRLADSLARIAETSVHIACVTAGQHRRGTRIVHQILRACAGGKCGEQNKGQEQFHR